MFYGVKKEMRRNWFNVLVVALNMFAFITLLYAFTLNDVSNIFCLTVDMKSIFQLWKNVRWIILPVAPPLPLPPPKKMFCRFVWNFLTWDVGIQVSFAKFSLKDKLIGEIRHVLKILFASLNSTDSFTEAFLSHKSVSSFLQNQCNIGMAYFISSVKTVAWGRSKCLRMPIASTDLSNMHAFGRELHGMLLIQQWLREKNC